MVTIDVSSWKRRLIAHNHWLLNHRMVSSQDFYQLYALHWYLWRLSIRLMFNPISNNCPRFAKEYYRTHGWCRTTTPSFQCNWWTWDMDDERRRWENLQDTFRLNWSTSGSHWTCIKPNLPRRFDWIFRWGYALSHEWKDNSSQNYSCQDLLKKSVGLKSIIPLHQTSLIDWVFGVK